MTGMPWGKWFWRDWLSDLGLRQVSPAARGIWMDMLCVAAQADPVGHVIMGGKSITDEGIARLCGITPEEATRLRIELESAEIFSRNKVGTIYCRRMVRDAIRRDKAVESGKKGGNPRLRKDSEKASSDKHDTKGTENDNLKGHVNDAVMPTVDHTDNDRSNPQKLEARIQRPESTPDPAPPGTPTVQAVGPSPAASARGSTKVPKPPTPEDLEWGELRVKIVEAYESSNMAVLPDTGWVDIWRGRGYSTALCLTIVKTVLKAKAGTTDAPGSLKFFDKAIEREHEKVLEARRKAAGSPPPQDAPPIDWERVMEGWVKSQGMAWPFKNKPPPGSPGCPVPRQILTKYLPSQYPPLSA